MLEKFDSAEHFVEGRVSGATVDCVAESPHYAKGSRVLVSALSSTFQYYSISQCLNQSAALRTAYRPPPYPRGRTEPILMPTMEVLVHTRMGMITERWNLGIRMSTWSMLVSWRMGLASPAFGCATPYL